jgi:excisionase family DNA binding protein
MTARGPVPTTTLQLLAPPAPARPLSRRTDAHEIIDLTLRTDNRLLLSVEEAAERLGIGRSLMYELIGSGQVASIRVGRLRRISPEARRSGRDRPRIRRADCQPACRPVGISPRPRLPAFSERVAGAWRPGGALRFRPALTRRPAGCLWQP